MSAADPRHARLEELIALDALDGLDAAERAELDAALADHGPDCAGCAELFADYAEAAATLALALPGAQPSQEAEDRLIAAALARDLDSPAGGVPGAGPLTVVPGGGRDAADGPGVARAAERRQGSSVRRWVALVAVAATLGVGIVAGFVAAPRAPSGTKDLIAFAARPGTRLAAFPTKDGGRLTVAYRPGETRAWIFGSGLTKPSGGRTYELWWGAAGTPLSAMNAAGLFVPIHGEVIAPVSIGASDPGTVLGVTIEPPGGSDEPTTQPVFVTTV
jgi:hypothetical protein